MAGWKSWICIFDGTVIFLFFNALSEEERIGKEKEMRKSNSMKYK